MTCTNCTKARAFPGYRFFCPACVYCGSRLIQHLGTYRIPPQECVQRRRQVLADWTARGHTEAQLRALAKGPQALAPLPEPEPTKKK